MTTLDGVKITLRPGLLWTAGLFGLIVILIAIRLLSHHGFSDNGHLGWRSPLGDTSGTARDSIRSR
jgi:hypothetical protein